MRSIAIQIYQEPHRDMDVEGTAELRQDIAGRYWLNNVKVVTICRLGEFTALACVDSQTHYVQTCTFEQVERADESSASTFLRGSDDVRLF
jgi:hypothetical protein